MQVIIWFFFGKHWIAANKPVHLIFTKTIFGNLRLNHRKNQRRTRGFAREFLFWFQNAVDKKIPSKNFAVWKIIIRFA